MLLNPRLAKTAGIAITAYIAAGSVVAVSLIPRHSTSPVTVSATGGDAIAAAGATGNIRVLVPQHPARATLASLCYILFQERSRWGPHTADHESPAVHVLVGATGGTPDASKGWCRTYLYGTNPVRPRSRPATVAAPHRAKAPAPYTDQVPFGPALDPASFGAVVQVFETPSGR